MRVLILLVFFLSACGNDARQGYETIYNLIENENFGQYKAGRQVGLWESYDKNGGLFKSTYYPETD